MSICLNTFMAFRRDTSRIEEGPFPALNVNFLKAIELLCYYSLGVPSYTFLPPSPFYLLFSPFSSTFIYFSFFPPSLLSSLPFILHQYFSPSPWNLMFTIFRTGSLFCVSKVFFVLLFSLFPSPIPPSSLPLLFY